MKRLIRLNTIGIHPETTHGLASSRQEWAGGGISAGSGDQEIHGDHSPGTGSGLPRMTLVALLSCWTLIVLFLVMTSGMAAEDPQWEELIFKANQAYKEGQFQQAIDGYRRLIDEGHGNGHIFYNLGNSHVRLNQLGEAILNYERARLVLPRDPDLDFNLGYARDQIQDVVPEPESSLGMTFFWLKSLNLVEVVWGFAILNCLFWGVLLLRLFVRPEWTYYLFLVLLFFWVIAGGSLGLKWYQVRTDDRAVILKQEVDVLAGPDAKDTILFKLHQGSIVNHEREEDGWSLIRFPGGKRGWVGTEAMEKI